MTDTSELLLAEDSFRDQPKPSVASRAPAEAGRIGLRCDSRRWLVEDVVEPDRPGADYDARGQSLNGFWDYEPPPNPGGRGLVGSRRKRLRPAVVYHFNP